MNAIELITPIIVHGRLINTFASEKKPMETLGFKNIKTMRDYFVKKFNFNTLNLPENTNGQIIVDDPDLLFQEKTDFFYLSEIEIDAGDFLIAASVSVEGRKVNNRKIPGCTFKIIHANFISKGS